MSGQHYQFELTVNPYDCLGVERGCRDMKKVRNAYKRKSIILHPDKNNGLTLTEFVQLNKSFLYLKTLIDEIKSAEKEFGFDVEEKLVQVKHSKEYRPERSQRVGDHKKPSVSFTKPISDTS